MFHAATDEDSGVGGSGDGELREAWGVGCGRKSNTCNWNVCF